MSRDRLKFLVTGGSGFIGSAFIRYLIESTEHSVTNLDKLTYAANRYALQEIERSDRYWFSHADVCDRLAIDNILTNYQPDIVVHLAAETHVDRSIIGSGDFLRTNVVGTYELLEACRSYLKSLSGGKRSNFRFHYVSTDEVFGDLEELESPFVETSNYRPSSPYSATKASADHLVQAWIRTYDFPAVISNCSNNYGPFQDREKLIPRVILNALAGRQIPVYGDGLQIRDWLFVEDHVKALLKIATEAHIGERYNIGGFNERANLDVVQFICRLLDEMSPVSGLGQKNYSDLITLVTDRPGHDRRYAIDSTKIKEELGWTPVETIETGLRKTVRWYIDNSTRLGI